MKVKPVGTHVGVTFFLAFFDVYALIVMGYDGFILIFKTL
jgi:hypothetical protein